MASSLASGASPPAKHKLCIFVESRETARGWQLCQPTPRASSIKVLSVKRTRALLPKHCLQPRPLLPFVWCWGCACRGAFRTRWLAKGNAFQTSSPLPCRNGPGEKWGYNPHRLPKFPTASALPRYSENCTFALHSGGLCKGTVTLPQIKSSVAGKTQTSDSLAMFSRGAATAEILGLGFACSGGRKWWIAGEKSSKNNSGKPQQK